MARVENVTKRIDHASFHVHAGIDSLKVIGEALSADPKIIETDALTQAELEAKVASYIEPTVEEITREEVVRTKIETGIQNIRTELGAWPDNLAALAGNANLATTVAKVNELITRVNQTSAQLRRVTERQEKLGQLALGRYDVPEA